MNDDLAILESIRGELVAASRRLHAAAPARRRRRRRGSRGLTAVAALAAVSGSAALARDDVARAGGLAPQRGAFALAPVGAADPRLRAYEIDSGAPRAAFTTARGARVHLVGAR